MREFCLQEKVISLRVRLDMLCENWCEVPALNLVAATRRCLAIDEQFLASCPTEQRDHFLDLHLALLFYKKYKADCVKVLGLLSLEDGFRLVQRFISRDASFGQGSSTSTSSSSAVPVTKTRIWRHRNSLKVAELASQCLVTQALTLCPPPASLSPLAVQLVQLEKTMGKTNQEVTDMLHKLVDQNHKITSAHMYALSSALASQVMPSRFYLFLLLSSI